MNRAEALQYLVDNLEEWPVYKCSEYITVAQWTWVNTSMGDWLDSDHWDERISEGDWLNAKKINTIKPESKQQEPPSPYHVQNLYDKGEYVDFYRLWDMIKQGRPNQIGDSAIDHGVKKLMVLGGRSGGKSKLTDLKEAVWSLNRAIEDIEKHNANELEVVGDE